MERLATAETLGGQAASAEGRLSRNPWQVRGKGRNLLGRSRGVWAVSVFAYLFTFVVLFPLLWIVLLSFESNSRILSDPFGLGHLSLQNYQTVLRTLNLLIMYKNTFILAVSSVILEVVVTFALSFALSRMAFRRRWIRSALRYFVFAGLAVPVYVLLFPVYKLDLMFHVFGTYLALILPYVAGSVPFNTLLFTGFMADFPVEVEEAAIVDGCSLSLLCRRITFPMLKPVVTTVVVFNILYIWNEFPFAVTLINKSSLTTVALGVSQFQGMWLVDYGAMMAAAVMVLVPQLVLYVVFQRRIVEGMTLGAVKG